MGIKICPDCKGKVSESRLDCPHCGYIFNDSVNKVLCPDCGEMVIVTANNECPICGHVFDNNNETFNPFPAPTPIEEPTIFEIQILPSGKKKLIKCTDEYAEKVEIPEGIIIVGKEAFKGLQYLKEVKLPSSVTIIEDEAFADCPILEIEFSNNINIGKDVIVGTLTEKKLIEKKKAELKAKEEAERKAKEEAERIAKEKWQKKEVGCIGTFGTYPQDSNGEVQPIEWQVLENDGASALLISKYALDCKKYHNTREDITWDRCDLRNWLNTTFINTAFTKEEQNKIKLSEVTADINPKYTKTPQGNNIKDKIFLLSINEVNKYFSNDQQRVTKGTPYCYNQGAWKNNGNCWWWLRSSGNNALSAASVYSDGSVDCGGYYVDLTARAVRPALRINL